eukprot:scaffold676_cov316-Pavlova_lutheri.AAC.52
MLLLGGGPSRVRPVRETVQRPSIDRKVSSPWTGLGSWTRGGQEGHPILHRAQDGGKPKHLRFLEVRSTPCDTHHEQIGIVARNSSSKMVATMGEAKFIVFVDEFRKVRFVRQPCPSQLLHF